MRIRNTSRNTRNRMKPAFVGADSRISEPKLHLPNSSTRPGQHQDFIRSTPKPPTPGNEAAELLADIDGLPVLVRFLVKNITEEGHSDLVSNDANLHSLLSSTLEKMVARMRGSSPRSDLPSKEPLATVELISSAEHLARLSTLPNDTVLRVGPLELDLLDRTAKRGDRQIDLRPREFQLLKYMMQRSDKLLTRAALLKEVWHYRFVPETNLVDVHMGRVRRKVDCLNEPPLIRNVRGVGFVLSANPLSPCSPQKPVERSAAWSSDKPLLPAEGTLQ
jgi:DNA-binding winged helix-turn-helix (wHTH) protein